jgi:hypothetical protein
VVAVTVVTEGVVSVSEDVTVVPDWVNVVIRVVVTRDVDREVVVSVTGLCVYVAVVVAV